MSLATCQRNPWMWSSRIALHERKGPSGAIYELSELRTCGRKPVKQIMIWDETQNQSSYHWSPKNSTASSVQDIHFASGWRTMRTRARVLWWRFWLRSIETFISLIAKFGDNSLVPPVQSFGGLCGPVGPSHPARFCLKVDGYIPIFEFQPKIKLGNLRVFCNCYCHEKKLTGEFHGVGNELHASRGYVMTFQSRDFNRTRKAANGPALRNMR